MVRLPQHHKTHPHISLVGLRAGSTGASSASGRLRDKCSYVSRRYGRLQMVSFTLGHDTFYHLSHTLREGPGLQALDYLR